MAAPYALDTSTELREDGRLRWSDFSSNHADPAPTGVALTTTASGITMTLGAEGTTSFSIRNAGGLFTNGVLLNCSGPGSLRLTPSEPVQGMGVTFEHISSTQATYQLQALDAAGSVIATVSAPSPGAQGNPRFIGVTDPESRIASVILSADPANTFVITDPIFQNDDLPEDDYSLLPVASSKTFPLSATDTYLHQGLSPKSLQAFTDDASEDNQNAYSLAEEFPGFKAGDLLRFERLGISYRNNVTNVIPPLAVFTGSETIFEGKAFKRLPDPIEAGRDHYTNQTSQGPFSTPTNIPEDFLIGTSTFVPIPAGANFLLFSMAEPGPDIFPTDVRVSHIPRAVFQDWLDTYGLHGPLAAPDSDLDGDGLTLIEEFAYLKNPTERDEGTTVPYGFAPKISPLGGSGDLILTYGARTDAPLVFSAEFSDDLSNWQTAPEASLGALLSDSDNPRSLFIARDPGNGPKRFGRIGVRLSSP